MKAGLISRLQRLEDRALVTSQPYTMRFGPLRRLPKEFVGERHVAIVRPLPPDSSGFEQYEFEERPGPGPKLTFGDKAALQSPCSW